MSDDKKLTVEEKLKIIRLAKNFTQMELADALGCNHSIISRAENGKETYSRDQVSRVKAFLEIENAPLLDDEIVLFRGQIYRLLNLIKDENLEEVRKILEDLRAVKQLPFEPDLVMLYEMAEIRLLLKLRDIEAARKNLKLMEAKVGTATKENLYHYYFNMGSLSIYDKDGKEALRFLASAHKLGVGFNIEEPTLNFNLAMCQALFGKYLIAISLLERVHYLFEHDSESAESMRYNNVIGLYRLRLGHAEKAIEHFEKALEIAKLIKNELYIGCLLHNHGHARFILGDYKEAIEYLDQVFRYFEKDDEVYLETLYRKIRCLIAAKSHINKSMLSDGILLAKDNEYYLMLFNSLKHLLTLKDENSLKYIEETTIPSLINEYKYDEVMDYCNILKEAYEKRLAMKSLPKSQEKSLEIKLQKIERLAFEIYKEMTSGKEVET